MSADREQSETAAPGAMESSVSPPATGWKRSVLYPNAYVWFVFLAALDIMLTYLILHPVLFFRDPDMLESRGVAAEVHAPKDEERRYWIDYERPADADAPEPAARSGSPPQIVPRDCGRVAGP